MISCAEAVRRLWEYLDGVVEEGEREAVEEHLSFCRRCCGELEFAEELRGVLAAQRSNELPDHVRVQLRSTLDELEQGG